MTHQAPFIISCHSHHQSAAEFLESVQTLADGCALRIIYHYVYGNASLRTESCLTNDGFIRRHLDPPEIIGALLAHTDMYGSKWSALQLLCMSVPFHRFMDFVDVPVGHSAFIVKFKASLEHYDFTLNTTFDFSYTLYGACLRKIELADGYYYFHFGEPKLMSQVIFKAADYPRYPLIVTLAHVMPDADSTINVCIAQRKMLARLEVLLHHIMSEQKCFCILTARSSEDYFPDEAFLCGKVKDHFYPACPDVQHLVKFNNLESNSLRHHLPCIQTVNTATVQGTSEPVEFERAIEFARAAKRPKRVAPTVVPTSLTPRRCKAIANERLANLAKANLM